MADNLLGDDKERYELHSRPAATDKQRWPADFFPALPAFQSFLESASSSTRPRLSAASRTSNGETTSVCIAMSLSE